MRNLLKALQALGIATTGVGLTLGIARNSMGDEYLYAGLGIILFYIARFVEKRLPEG
ncbi:MAG: hypothetical protein ABI444_01060 [Candidatus Kapaibacterium sp.]|jgi:hypothetical protein